MPEKKEYNPVSQKKKKEKEEEYKPRIRIKLRAYDHKIIDEAARSIIQVVEKTGAKVRGPIPLPTERKLYTVLKSTFIKKDSREQFERRIHKRLIDIFEPTSKTIEAMSTLTLPAGVEIEIKM